MKNKAGILALWKKLFITTSCIVTFLSLVYAGNINPTSQKKTHNIKFKRISINQGLSQSTIYCMLQDRYGFMWFGTENGLNKYDGFSFSVYQHNPADSTSISGNRVLALFEDHAGNLWIGTIGGGLSKYNRFSDCFDNFMNDPNNTNSLSNNRVMSIYEDHNGFLWIGTAGGGLNKFDPKTRQFLHYLPELANINTLSNSIVRAIVEDRNGIIWVGTDGGGLNEFDPITGSFKRIKADRDQENIIPDNSVRTLHIDRYGMLWIGSNAGLSVYNPQNEEKKHFRHNDSDPFSISDDFIYSIFEDNRGRIWVGTNNGLNLFQRDTKHFISYFNDPNDLNSISNNIIRSIYQDRSGLFWIGTFRGGINKFEFDYLKFIHFRSSARFPNSLNHSVVSAIFEDSQGNLCLGTWGGGLNIIDPAWNRMEPYIHNASDKESLSNNIITCITEDKFKNLWIGTYENGMNQFDHKTRKFKRIEANSRPGALSNNRIMAILPDSSGNLWVSTFGGGLNYYDHKTGKFTQFMVDELVSNCLSNNRIWPLAYDRDGNLWIGTDGSGIDKLDLRTRTFYNYHHEPKNPNSISDNVIITIFTDNSGMIWIGTDGGGLNRFDPKTGNFKSYRTTDGLPNDVVTGILQDKSGFLWISTHRGLTRFSPENGIFNTYSEEEGLQSNEFNEGSCFYSSDGTMYFGGVNGFNAFIPENVKPNPTIPQIAITNIMLMYHPIKIGRKSPLKRQINFTDEISFYHNQNVISLEFSALTFSNPENNLYSYMLEGFDKTWSEPSNRRFVTYTNLNPGKYVFRVKTASADRIWNNEEKVLKITIIPPFWFTWWFIALVTGVAGGIVFYILRKREHIIRNERKKLEEIIAKRTKEIQKQKEELEKANIEIKQSSVLKEMFLANTSHEIRTPLNVINGFTNLLLNTPIDEKQKAYLENIKNSSNNLNILINDILDFSKIEAGKLSLEEIDFNFRDVIHSIISSNSIKANEKKLKFTYHIDDNIPPILNGDPLRLHQILLNLLQNAIKFTEEGGSVSLLIDKHQETNSDITIIFKIADTGIGIPTEKLSSIFNSFTQIRQSSARLYGGTGLGLSIVKRLVDLHAGEIKVQSRENVGSEFIVKLRYKKSDKQNIENLEPTYRIRKNEQLSALHILLVEDNEINTALACDTILLYNNNIKIDVAVNGLEAIKKASEILYDIIIMDIQMPEMDGYEATQHIREKLPEPYSKVPILGMSAHAMQEEREKCFVCGMNDYLTKPFVPEKLFEKIELLTHIGAQPALSEYTYNASEKATSLKIIDLTLLNSTYRNDHQKIARILKLYLKNIPANLKELEISSQKKDKQSLRVTAHSLKTSFNYIGLNSARDICKSIENDCISGKQDVFFDPLIGKIKSEWENAEHEIRNHLLFLK